MSPESFTTNAIKIDRYFIVLYFESYSYHTIILNYMHYVQGTDTWVFYAINYFTKVYSCRFFKYAEWTVQSLVNQYLVV